MCKCGQMSCFLHICITFTICGNALFHPVDGSGDDGRDSDGSDYDNGSGSNGDGINGSVHISAVPAVMILTVVVALITQLF